MLFTEKNHPKLIGLIALVGLSAASIAQQGAQSPVTDPVAAMPPVDCVVSPHKVIDLASAVPGVIEAMGAERSEFVEQDQVVARLASQVEQASVALAQQRAEIEAEVFLEEINLDFAERQQRRIDMLYDTDAVSFQNKDDADREVELSTWKLQQARDLLNVRKLELNRAYQQLEQKTVRAPISGFVVQTFKSEGEYVEDQPILRIAKLDPLNVDAIVPIDMFGKIEVGMTAKVRLETLSIPTQEAEVTIVDKMGDAASGTFGVRLSLPNPENRIPAGLKCDLNFVAEPEIVDTSVDSKLDTDSGDSLEISRQMHDQDASAAPALAQNTMAERNAGGGDFADVATSPF